MPQDKENSAADLRAWLDDLWATVWLDIVGPADLAHMLESEESAKSYLTHQDPVRRSVALQVVTSRWEHDTGLVPICKNLALHDADSRVRRCALSWLSFRFVDTKDADIGDLLAEVVCDASAASDIREEAYEGLFRIWGVSLLAALLRARARQGCLSQEVAWVAERIQFFHGLGEFERDECPTCRSQRVNVLRGCRTELSTKDQVLIAWVRGVVGPDDGQPCPDSVCLVCSPEWREFNDLAVLVHQCQLSKENAVAAGDFARAVSMREEQRQLRARQQAALERLRTSRPP